MALRIASFNCENLFGRYRILDKPPGEIIKNFESLFQIPEVIAFEPGRGPLPRRSARPRARPFSPLTPISSR